ncbi:MAG: hypothetical protein JOZ42_02390 [Acetobacteraceae bacterium]|nr:hypothetical protein [Acetobacteraceae bacterium]
MHEQHWQFVCPECGFGHIEIGVLAADHEVYCIVCLEESDRHIVIHRWLATDDEPETTAMPGNRIAA